MALSDTKFVQMTKKEIEERKFRPAREEADDAAKQTGTPQTRSEAYKLAFQDAEFLLREDLRPVRFQLELLKPQLLMDEAKIESTFVFYGSARIPQPEQVQARIDAATTPQQKRIAENLGKKAVYYEEARKLARIAAQYPVNEAGCRHFVVCSGGGPSIMEADPHPAVRQGFLEPGGRFRSAGRRRRDRTERPQPPHLGRKRRRRLGRGPALLSGQRSTGLLTHWAASARCPLALPVRDD